MKKHLCLHSSVDSVSLGLHHLFCVLGECGAGCMGWAMISRALRKQ